MEEKDFPALYGAADAASKLAQRNFFTALAANLICLVVASVLSVANVGNSSFAIAQASLLLISLSLVIFLAHKQPQKIWYGTRALAESVKTITWRYVMRAEPYDSAEQDARKHFVQVLRKVLESNKHAGSHAVETMTNDQITQRMSEIRSFDLLERRNFYVKQRVENQLIWYRGKALFNRARSSRWFVGLVSVNALALICALFRIANPQILTWPTDIFVACAGAAMAWLQTKRFQELAASYSLTAHEISLLHACVPSGDDEREFSVFVADSESAFSREHIQWQARRDEE